MNGLLEQMGYAAGLGEGSGHFLDVAVGLCISSGMVAEPGAA